MAIDLEAKSVKKTDEKIKVKFNCCTMVIKDVSAFATNVIGIEKDKFLFYPAPHTYKHYVANQEYDLSNEEFALIEAQHGGKIIEVNNERMGKLRKIYEERLATASPSEKKYIKENEHEFTACSFNKPIYEVI